MTTPTARRAGLDEQTGRLFALADQVIGFMPADEGRALYDAALRVPRRRRRRRDRHVLRQVHGPAGRGGAEHRQRAVHHRPPPRLRGAPARMGVPRHLAWSIRTPDSSTPCRPSGTRSTPPTCPTTSWRWWASRRWWLGAGARRCSCCSSTAATPRKPRSGTSTAGRSGWRRRRAGHPRRLPEPRRRWSGALPDLPPRAGQRCIPGGVGDGLAAGAGAGQR